MPEVHLAKYRLQMFNKQEFEKCIIVLGFLQIWSHISKLQYMYTIHISGYVLYVCNGYELYRLCKINAIEAVNLLYPACNIEFLSIAVKYSAFIVEFVV